MPNKYALRLAKITKGFECHTDYYRYFAILERYAGKSNTYCLIQEDIGAGIVSIVGREIPIELCRELIAKNELTLDMSIYKRTVKTCRHPVNQRREGPRVPMRYGTGPTELCKKCGAWRNMLHKPGPWTIRSLNTKQEDNE